MVTAGNLVTASELLYQQLQMYCSLVRAYKSPHAIGNTGSRTNPWPPLASCWNLAAFQDFLAVLAMHYV